MRHSIARFIAAFSIVLAAFAGYMSSDWLVDSVETIVGKHRNLFTEVRLSSHVVTPPERGLVAMDGHYVEYPGVTEYHRWLASYSVMYVSPVARGNVVTYLPDVYYADSTPLVEYSAPVPLPASTGGLAPVMVTSPGSVSVAKSKTDASVRESHKTNAGKPLGKRSHKTSKGPRKPKPKPRPFRNRLPSYPSSADTFWANSADTDPLYKSDLLYAGDLARPDSRTIGTKHNILVLLSGVLMFIAALLCARDRRKQRILVAFVLAAMGCGFFTHLVYLPVFNCLLFAVFLAGVVMLAREEWLLERKQLGLLNIWVAVGTLGVLFVLLQVNELRHVIIVPSKTVPLFLAPLMAVSGLLCLLHCARSRHVPCSSKAVRVLLVLIVVGWLLRLAQGMIPPVYEFLFGLDKLGHSALQTGRACAWTLLAVIVVPSIYFAFIRYLSHRLSSASIARFDTGGHSLTNLAPATGQSGEHGSNRLLGFCGSNIAELTFYLSLLLLTTGLAWMVLAPGGLGELLVNWLRESLQSSSFSSSVFNNDLLRLFSREQAVPHIGRKIVKLSLVVALLASLYPHINYISAVVAWTAKKVIANPTMSPLMALAMTLKERQTEIVIWHRFPTIRAIGCTIILYVISYVSVFVVYFLLDEFDWVHQTPWLFSVASVLSRILFEASYASMIAACILTMMLAVFMPRLAPRKLVLSTEGLLLNKGPYWRMLFRPLRQWSDVSKMATTGEGFGRALNIDFASGGSFRAYIGQIHPDDLQRLVCELANYCGHSTVGEDVRKQVASHETTALRNLPCAEEEHAVSPSAEAAQLVRADTSGSANAGLYLPILLAIAILAIVAACGLHPIKAAGKCIAIATPLFLLAIILRALMPILPATMQDDLKRSTQGKEIAPRLVRIVAFVGDQLKPFLLGASFIASAPTILAGAAWNWLLNKFKRVKDVVTHDSTENQIVLLQNRCRRIDPKAEPFWLTSAFSYTLAAIALSCAPAMFALTIFTATGYDGVMHNVTLDPQWNQFKLDLFYMPCAICGICPLVFRAIFLMPCDHMSWQSAIEIDSAGIRKGNASGWCANVLFFSMFPAFYTWKASWSEIERVEFAEAGFGRLSPLPDTLYPKNSWLYRTLAALSELTDAIVDRTGRAEWIVLRKRGDMDDAPGLRIQLWDLSEADRETLLRSLRKWAPSVPIDDAAIQHLESSKENLLRA